MKCECVLLIHSHNKIKPQLLTHRHNSKQLNRTLLWSSSPTRDSLTDFSEIKANYFFELSKKCMWLFMGQNQWHVIHEKFFHDRQKKNHPVCVNLHIVTLE